MELSLLLAIADTAITAILVFYAGVQIWLMRKDLQEAKINRCATVTLEVLTKMNNLRDKWHQLYGLPQDHHEWNAGQRKLADEVGVGLQQVAFLTETGLIEKQYVFENYANVFFKSWQRLEQSIKDLRMETGDQFQRIHLEQFAKECKNYLDKRAQHRN